METVNERFLHEAISHAVDIQRYSNSVVRKIIALLNKVDASLAFQIANAAERMGAESFTVQRLDGLLQSVRALNAQAFAAVNHELPLELRRFAEYESGYESRLYLHVLPVEIKLRVASVNAEQVYAAAMSRPMQGRLLSEWSQSIEETRMARVRDAIRVGIIQNQTATQIVQTIRGTKSGGYADGLLEIDRRSVESVVRTAVSHVAAFTRDKMQAQNSDLIKALSWTSTLDSRTTEICILRDGKQYTPDTHKPIGHALPWLAGPGAAHWCCVPGETLVTSAGRVKSVMRRWFDGDFIVVETASGKSLSCTPNHPVLTTRGWVAAQLLNDRDQVVCDGGREWVTPIDYNNQEGPARIEDITSTFLKSSGVLAVKVPVSAPDFHGDGVGSDVAVIGTDRRLSEARQSSIPQPADEKSLVRRDSLALVLESSRGVLGALLEGARASFRDAVSICKKPAYFFRSGLRHAGELLLASVSTNNASGAEMSCDYTGRSIEAGSDACNANPAIEQRDHFVNRKLDQLQRRGATVLTKYASNNLVSDFESSGDFIGGDTAVSLRNNGGGIELMNVAANHYIAASQEGTDGYVAEANLAADILSGSAGPVFLDNVVSIRRTRFSGHVFNLETERGHYTANGIVTHNCRSVSVPVMKSWQELGIDIPEFKGSRASMDGQVPADMSYGDWLKKQSAARQDEVLGATRGKLLRDGGLTIDRFANDKGRWLSLEELRAKDSAAFARAGV